MKPTITLCKDDETAFVNVRTFWALVDSRDDISYELRNPPRVPRG